MTAWLFLHIFMPLIPIPLVYISYWILGRPTSIAVISDGQLCFYSTSIASITIYDLIKVEAKAEIGALLIGIIFLMILSTFTFGVTVICNQLNTADYHGQMTETSSTGKLALMSVLSAFATCILVIYIHWWIEKL